MGVHKGNNNSVVNDGTVNLKVDKIINGLPAKEKEKLANYFDQIKQQNEGMTTEIVD